MIHALVGILMQALVFFGLASVQPPALPVHVHGSAVEQHETQSSSTVVMNSQQPAQAPVTAGQQASHPIPVNQSSVAALPAGGAWETSLMLGDYKYVTSAPKKGYIYLCHIATGGRGAQVNGPWIHGSSWSPSEKVAVEGEVSWPTASVSIKISNSMRTITSNDLPTDHTTGIFPISSSDPASQYDHNPSSIEAEQYSFSVPASPIAAAAPNCIYGEVGILSDGVLLLDGFDAEYRDALAHEEQDSYEGHPNDMGYHDHGFEAGPVKDPVSQVVGFAFDGYPITGSLLPDGKYLHTADLDECHGLTSTIELDGKEVTTYHYVLTQDFPYSVSCFHGKSYEPHPGGGQSAANSTSYSSSQQQLQKGPPQAAIDACSSKSTNASCSFSTTNGTIFGTCRVPPNQSSLACVPNQ